MFPCAKTSCTDDVKSRPDSALVQFDLTNSGCKARVIIRESVCKGQTVNISFKIEMVPLQCPNADDTQRWESSYEDSSLLFVF